MPILLVSRLKVKRKPSKIEERINDTKQIKAKRICIRNEFSVKTPTPTTDTPVVNRLMAPTKPRRLPWFIRAKEMANIDKRRPVSIRPELKMRATSEMPRSLRALFVQLNQGDRVIEIPMKIAAQIGAMSPSQAAISGSKTLLSRCNSLKPRYYSCSLRYILILYQTIFRPYI